LAGKARAARATIATFAVPAILVRRASIAVPFREVRDPRMIGLSPFVGPDDALPTTLARERFHPNPVQMSKFHGFTKNSPDWGTPTDSGGWRWQ
jgi:hypothetical protein